MLLSASITETVSNHHLEKRGEYAAGHPQQVWFLWMGQRSEPSWQGARVNQEEVCEMTEGMMWYCFKESSDLRLNSL